MVQDATRYFVSLPSNKLELWFAMESERFRVRGQSYLYYSIEAVGCAQKERGSAGVGLRLDKG